VNTTMLSKEKTNRLHKNIIIAGVGNRLLGDEGLGSHIIDSLSRIPLPSDVSIIDCGCDLLSIIPCLNEPRKIIVIDAVRAGGKPGRIYRFDYSKLQTTQAQMQSAHQIGPTDALGLLRRVYPALSKCEIIIIGIEPKAIEPGAELSEEIIQSFSNVKRLVLKELLLCSTDWQECLCVRYHRAQKKWFDIYSIGKNIGVNISNALSSIHTGVLPSYLVWVLAGLAILLLINYIIAF